MAGGGSLRTGGRSSQLVDNPIGKDDRKGAAERGRGGSWIKAGYNLEMKLPANTQRKTGLNGEEED